MARRRALNGAEIFVGCAGWSLARDYWPRFPDTGTHLERYAARFRAAEINSSFYRPHRRATYEKWAASVPEGFRFSVKTPRTLTHENRLAHPERILESFLEEISGLGVKLGCLLVQMPASLAFEHRVAESFFTALRRRYDGTLVLEPRQRGWFEPDAEALLRAHHVARAAADPALVPQAAQPGGWHGAAYFRLHGSPRMYYSTYPPAYLESIAQTVARQAHGGIPVWCIFDNTAGGAAVGNALDVIDLLAQRDTRPATLRKRR